MTPRTPTTEAGRRLLATFETGTRTNNSYRAVILAIEDEARAPLDGGVDGVDCDWDERGKCRCRAATPASLDVERLARAMRAEDIAFEADFRNGQKAWTWERHAEALAREYAALEEPTP
jgi:hypothetical protein